MVHPEQHAADTADRAGALERKFTVPVVLAALASVPAMLLTAMEGAAATVGEVINWLTLAVFVTETVVLFVVSGDKLRWLWEHKLIVGVTLVTVPAVIFAIGPVQLLRLLRFVRFIGALRILRVGRVIKAARILRNRAGLTGWAWNAVVAVLALACAAFVAIVLSDPTSPSRQLLEDVVGHLGVWAVILAGVILAVATYVVARARLSSGDDDGHQERADGEDRPDGASDARDAAEQNSHARGSSSSAQR